jgi:excinuclease UvrABC nuclease subunit
MNWTTYTFPMWTLPRCAGVYVLYIDNELVYVGQSVDICNRFSEHSIRYGYAQNIITPWGDYPSSARIQVKVKRSKRLGDWAMDEIRLIHRLQPRFNRQHKRRKRA